MGMGDELMAAGQAQRVYDADPSRRVAICDAAGRPRWHELWEGNPIIATPAQVAAGEPVHRIRNAIGCRPYIRYPFTHQTGWTFTDWRASDHVGRLYLTEAELSDGRALAASIGPFVVVEPSPIKTSNANKAWGFDRFRTLVTACPEVRFVQLQHPEAIHLPGVTVVSVRTFRQACGVLAAAAAYVGPEGGLHHACAVLGAPAVVIFGGCCSVSTTGYPQHVNIADDGPGTPCGRWLRCSHCEAAMARITVDRVSGALRTLLAGHVREVA